MATEPQDDLWQVWWDARQAAFEKLLGPADDRVFHAVLPLYLGGNADVLSFRPPDLGVCYVTSDLIGDDGQIQSELGNFELMICHRSDEKWGPDIISNLARYTLEAKLQPWETMDIGPAVQAPSNIVSFVFAPFAEFIVRDRPCGILLCLGITAEELQRCRASGSRDEVERLKKAGIYPFTDLSR